MNGNKARKLDFVVHNIQAFDSVVTYGGYQSNMLFALSYLCFVKQKKLTYYTKPIPLRIKQNLVNEKSNLAFAMHCDVQIVEVPLLEWDEMVVRLHQESASQSRVCFVPQGGRESWASEGLEKLAKEVQDYACMRNTDKPLDVFVSSGTGTTAYFLQSFLPRLRVFTVPCVGDKAYLREQFAVLGNSAPSPVILTTKKKYHFGKCYDEFWKMHQQMVRLGVEFELLYDMKALMAIGDNADKLHSDILYIHCGGTYGNNSMTQRYARRDNS